MLLPFAFLLTLAPSPQALDPTLTPTAGGVTIATAQGRGVQVYHCTEGNGGTYAWVLQGPEATLSEPTSGERLGTHSQGPTWTWSDGSSITGSVLTTMASPDAGSVPWLLVKTHAVQGTHGVLSTVTLVRRSDTKGGMAPPVGCDAQHGGTSQRVPYTATYTFYNTAEPPAIVPH